MSDAVRALSLWRPWPFCILHREKNVENRSWPTQYRGLLVIHAGRTLQQDVLETLTHPVFGEPKRPAMTHEGYVGTVELVGCHHASDCGGCSEWADEVGYHWEITNPRAFTAPIPGPGSRRLYVPPQNVTAQLARGGAR